MTKDKSFTIRVPRPVADMLKKYIPEKIGLTVNELSQLILFFIFAAIHEASDLDPSIIKHIETSLDPLFFSANEEASRLLQCLREIREGKAQSDSSPTAIIAILDGGVSIVIDPKHKQYTLNRSRPFELIFSLDPEWAKLIKKVQNGHKGSPLMKILFDILREECDFIDRQQPATITTI